jgi:hypothetical protein
MDSTLEGDNTLDTKIGTTEELAAERLWEFVMGWCLLSCIAAGVVLIIGANFRAWRNIPTEPLWIVNTEDSGDLKDSVVTHIMKLVTASGTMEINGWSLASTGLFSSDNAFLCGGDAMKPAYSKTIYLPWNQRDPSTVIQQADETISHSVHSDDTGMPRDLDDPTINFTSLQPDYPPLDEFPTATATPGTRAPRTSMNSDSKAPEYMNNQEEKGDDNGVVQSSGQCRF